MNSIINLPPGRWREAKELRLEALRNEPIAFASSYAEELAFPDDIWRTRLETADRRELNLTYFAEIEGELLGMAGANWQAREKLRHVATVYGVYVSPAWRGQGIAEQLMRRLLAELRRVNGIEKASLTVNAESLAALRLYERLGFERVGLARSELKVAGVYYDLLLMEKLL